MLEISLLRYFFLHAFFPHISFFLVSIVFFLTRAQNALHFKTLGNKSQVKIQNLQD